MGRSWAGVSSGSRYRQAKHHRWCLDEPQIRQYHLSRVLDPAKLWWEAIDLPVRTVQIVERLGVVAPIAYAAPSTHSCGHSSARNSCHVIGGARRTGFAITTV